MPTVGNLTFKLITFFKYKGTVIPPRVANLSETKNYFLGTD